MSVDQILHKIIADASQEAETLLRKAESDATARSELIQANAKKRIQEIEKKQKADAVEIERRIMLAAGLDARKNSLSRRRELLDRAFTLALDSYTSLPEAEYEALVLKLIVRASETGAEKVFVPAGDEKYYSGESSMLADANEALRKEGKGGTLCFGGISTKLCGGVLLSGETADIDCSFEALIAQFREEHEIDVSKILFEGEV